VRHFSDVSDDEVKVLAALQHPDGLVVGQAVEGAPVPLQDLVAQLKTFSQLISAADSANFRPMGDCFIWSGY
jgi:hypothetical protein